ncbi:MAG: WecB/TagA/CpsF family glycosyltransferase [Verrucomicrobia bacterium]|nr:WecB/TagA/CpsF family glycosyltransferase [Verrucomicrobiota bacterium]
MSTLTHSKDTTPSHLSRETAGIAEKREIFGLNFANVSVDEALDIIEDHFRSRDPLYIFTINVALLVYSREDPYVRKIYEECRLLTVDGMAIYYASKLLGKPLKASASASLMFEPLLARCAANNYKVFLIGASQATLEKAVTNLRQEHPGLRICGYHNGYFDHGNPPADLVSEINASEADLVMLGMSSPYKERFVRENMGKLNVPVFLGVGGMFDIAAGEARFAPDWIRKSCLEWLYRLLQEPRRMWKRYFYTNSVFVGLFLKAFARTIIRKP